MYHSFFLYSHVGERDENKRLQKYLAYLKELPPVNAVTLRRLLAHLHFIHEESEHNLMPVENLAAIWGPTLMHVEVSFFCFFSFKMNFLVLYLFQ